MPPIQNNGTPPCAVFFMLFAFGVGCSASKVSVGPDTLEPNENLGDTAKDSGQAQISDPSGDVVDLVVFDEWSLLADHMDPYPTHKNSDHQCDPKGVLPEENVLEINTNDCNYAIVGQPIRAGFEAGDWIELMMYHSALSALEEPAEAHFSVWIGETVFWERTISIPAAPEIYPVSIQAQRSAPKGELVRVHLHNHGGNSWRLAYIKRLRGDATP